MYILSLSDLCENFDAGLKEFYNNNNATFSRFYHGPCIHFHCLTIAKLRELNPKINGYKSIVNNSDYLNYLYATMSAWGMYRLGGGPKIQDFPMFKNSLNDPSFVDNLDVLKNKRLDKLNDIESIRENVKQLYEWLIEDKHLMDNERSLVGSSKLLHHLLPDILIPIDNKYTINLFSRLNDWRCKPTKNGYDFDNYWKCIRVSHFITKTKRIEEVKPTENYPMNTSIPKVIDNSIVGMSVIFNE